MGDNRAHAALGASSAHRWMACPGSVRLSEDRQGYQTEHSRAGTAAHAVAEMALTKGVDPDMWEGLEVEGVTVDEEMVEAVRVFVEYCRARMGGQHWIEHKFSLASLQPPMPMFGTADYVSYDPDRRILEVVDFKYGSGVVVEVVANKQLRYYGLGAALSMKAGLPIEAVTLTIIQPRASHPDGAIRSETIDYVELLAFAGELLDAARATLDPNAPLVPGPQCRWCLASPTCPAKRDQVQALAQVTFDAMPLDVPPSPGNLPAEVFWQMMSQKHILDDWSRMMEGEALRRLERGEGDGSFKLVARRPTRKWVSETGTETWLRNFRGYDDQDIFVQKLKSPAQIEKLVGKKNLPMDLYESKSSGYTLAPAADKRPALASGASEAFDALPASSE